MITHVRANLSGFKHLQNILTSVSLRGLLRLTWVETFSLGQVSAWETTMVHESVGLWDEIGLYYVRNCL